LGKSGTSFAAPLVSAAAAMVIAKYPAENYQQIIAHILIGTDPVPGLAGQCVTGGRLNLYKALGSPILLIAVPGTNGSPFQLTVSTGANRLCVIQSSPDLINWSPVFTNTTDTNGIFNFVDDNSTNASQLFYRAASAP
jgi:subtilisin family serine protease